MATNEQIRAALEALPLEKIQQQFSWFGASWMKTEGRPKEKVISDFIGQLGRRPEARDKIVDLLGLPTTAEQERQHRETAEALHLRSVTAAEESAKSAKTAVRISVAALLVSILAIVFAMTKCTN